MLENNKLIAEFLGWENLKETCLNVDEDTFIIDSNLVADKSYFNLELEGGISVCSMYAGYLKFSSDWNWLMLVVNKIENLSLETLVLKFGSHEDEFTNATFLVYISSIETKIDIFGDMKREKDFIVVDDSNDRIRNTHEACVEFIKWYNENGR